MVFPTKLCITADEESFTGHYKSIRMLFAKKLSVRTKVFSFASRMTHFSCFVTNQAVVASMYFAVKDSGTCVNCGTCVERCQFKARRLERASWFTTELGASAAASA